MSTPDRRTRLRFPLAADLRLQVLCSDRSKIIQGSGNMENISSKGLAFRTEIPLECGQRLNISLAWPAMLNKECMLRLVVNGTVIRIEGNLVVVRIGRHDFRTSGRPGSAAT